MTEEERRLLSALAGMCEQYLGRDGSLDHQFMSAGENAVALLAEHGLVESTPRGGTWTHAGRAVLAAG